MPVFGEDQRKKRGAPIVNEIVGRVNDNTKRLRLLEQRERLLTSRITSSDESFYQQIKDTGSMVRDLDSKIALQEERISTLENKLKELVKQLRFLATKTDLKRLDEKVKILSPLQTASNKGKS